MKSVSIMALNEESKELDIDLFLLKVLSISSFNIMTQAEHKRGQGTIFVARKMLNRQSPTTAISTSLADRLFYTAQIKPYIDQLNEIAEDAIIKISEGANTQFLDGAGFWVAVAHEIIKELIDSVKITKNKVVKDIEGKKRHALNVQYIQGGTTWVFETFTSPTDMHIKDGNFYVNGVKNPKLYGDSQWLCSLFAAAAMITALIKQIERSGSTVAAIEVAKEANKRLGRC